VANYNVDIELSVKGSQRLNQVKSSLNQINRLTNNLKPLNLLAPGGGSLGNQVRAAMKPLRDFARAAQNSNQTYSNTLAGAISQAETFETVLKNVKVAAGGYSKQVSEVKGFSDAFGQASAKAETLRRNLEQLKRESFQKAGLPVGPSTELGTLDADVKKLEFYTKQKEKEALARDNNAKKIAAEARELKRKNLSSEKEAKLNRRRRATDLATGVGFPLLMGGSPAQAIAGGLGGIFGGLGGSIIASGAVTGIETLVKKTDEFNKSLVKLNGEAQLFDKNIKFTAENVGSFAKKLGIAKEEAVKLLSSFQGIDSVLGREALALVFGDDPGGVDRIARATTQARLAEEIFSSYKKIGLSEADRLLDQLKVGDAAAVELGLAEALLKVKEKTLIADAKRVTLMDRFTAVSLSTQGRAGFSGGGMISPEIFGQKRAEKLQAELDSQREGRINTTIETIKEIRDVFGKLEGFEPEKTGRTGGGGGRGKSLLDQLTDSRDVGKDLIKQLNREIALINATTDEERKKLQIKYETEDEQIKINELLDAAQRITATSLNDERKRLELQQITTENLEKQAKAYMDLGLSQAGLSGINLDKTFFDEGTLATTTDPMSFGDSVAIGGIIAQEEAVESLLQKYQQFGEVAQLTAGLVTFGVQEMIDGTKSAEQVFADFLNSIADMLMKTAQQMIAQYIAIAIAKMFAGMGSAPQASDFNLSGFGGFASNASSGTAGFGLGAGGILGFADGGRPPVGRPSIVGERGPELFVPGASGTIIPNHAMGSSNVTVNVDASGSSVEGDAEQSKQLGKAIGIAVQQELIKQQRPGGLLG